MPTYEYECKKCGVVEVFQRITEPKLKKCPSCKGPVKRLLGAGAGIIFKGSGFYQTDYRSDSYKCGSKSESGSATTEASKADAKPAPKAESTAKSEPKAVSGAASKEKSK